MLALGLGKMVIYRIEERKIFRKNSFPMGNIGISDLRVFLGVICFFLAFVVLVLTFFQGLYPILFLLVFVFCK